MSIRSIVYRYMGRMMTGALLLVCMSATLAPHLAHALGPIVTCGNTIQIDTTSQPGSICYTGECTVCDAQRLAKSVLDFLIVLSTIIATLLFVNAGVLYIFSPAKPGNIEKAHHLFTSTLVGLVILLAAYLIIGTLMTLSTESSTWKSFLCQNEKKTNCVKKQGQVTVEGSSLVSGSPNVGSWSTLCISTAGACNAGTCTNYDYPGECRSAYSDIEDQNGNLPPSCGILFTNNGSMTCITKSCYDTQVSLAQDCPASANANVTHNTSKVSSADALAQLKDAGVRYSGVSSGQPIEQGVVDGLIALNQACRGCVVVTSLSGGTHTPNSGHYQGIKADIDDNNATIQYITNNWQQGSVRGGNYSGINWVDPNSGMVCVQESNHYDCCFNQTDSLCS